MRRCYTCKREIEPIGTKSQCSDCNKKRLKARRLKLKEINSQIEMSWEGTKFCTGCKETLPKIKFVKNDSEADRLSSRCKECQTLYQGLRIAKLLGHKYNPPTDMNGATLRAWKKLQKNKCALCGAKNKVRSLNLDHDHKTGLLRGYLCSFCNRALVPVLEKYPLLRSHNPLWEQYFLEKR